MKKILFVLLNILAIAGFFYATSPEFLKNSYVNRIDSIYRTVVQSSKAEVDNEIISSNDVDIYNMGSLLEGNKDIIESNVFNISDEDYIEVLKIKVLYYAKNIVLPQPAAEELDKMSGLSGILERRYLLIIIFSVIALICVISSGASWGILGGVGSALFYSLTWILLAFYFKGDLSESTTALLNEIFRNLSYNEFLPGFDKIYEFSTGLVFSQLLIFIVLFYIFGIWI
ncbi:MAG: hypothetical protein ACOCWO_03375, partial [Candidatus Muiribacteriaceae bacterium]